MHNHRLVQIIGTGSFHPPLASNEAMFALLDPKKPGGESIPPEWLKKYFGIETRAYDFDFAAGRKHTKEEGGIYDTDLALRAARAALRDAGTQADTISAVVHLSATPDFVIYGSPAVMLRTQAYTTDAAE